MLCDQSATDGHPSGQRQAKRQARCNDDSEHDWPYPAFLHWLLHSYTHLSPSHQRSNGNEHQLYRFTTPRAVRWKPPP